MFVVTSQITTRQKWCFKTSWSCFSLKRWKKATTFHLRRVSFFDFYWDSNLIFQTREQMKIENVWEKTSFCGLINNKFYFFYCSEHPMPRTLVWEDNTIRIILLTAKEMIKCGKDHFLRQTSFDHILWSASFSLESNFLDETELNR